MKTQILQTCAYILLGVIIGTFFNKCSNEHFTESIKYETITQIDTCVIKSIDVVHFDKLKIKQEIIRDTILIDYTPQIKAYSAKFPVKYGNVSVNGEVLGEVLKMAVVSDLDIPQITNTVTNTITKTEKIIKNPGGLFLTAGLNQTLTPSVGGVFVKKKLIAGYSYNFNSHQVFIGRKLF